MAQDALLTLADDQDLSTGWSGAGGTTGWQLSEHTINVGARQDSFNGQQLFAVLTIKTAFTFTNATDSFFFEIKTSQNSTALDTGAGAALTQEGRPTLARSARFLGADLTKGKRIVVALSPQTNSSGNIVNTPLGWGVIYGLLRAETVAFAAINMTGGTFDLEIRTENPAGQKYYPQTTSVG